MSTQTAAPPTTTSRPAAASAPRGPRTRRTGAVATQVFLWGYAIVAIAPLVIMLLGSFRESADIYREPLGFELPPSVDAYAAAWTRGNFSRYFLNSMIVTVSAVALTVAVSVPAAYALAQGRSRMLGVIESTFVSGLMLPVHLAILPVFHLLDGFHLVDTTIGLILVYGAVGVPFSIFVLTAFFRQLPYELEEAAQLDGAGPLRRFWLIMVPLVQPAIATIAVFRFVPVWNDFLYPLVLLRNRDNYTLSVGLTTFFGQYRTDWAALFAGLTIATVPLIVLFLFATKQIIAGLTAGMGK